MHESDRWKQVYFITEIAVCRPYFVFYVIPNAFKKHKITYIIPYELKKKKGTKRGLGLPRT